MVDTRAIQLEDLSSGADSGWRPLKEDLVETLVGKFKAGEYGASLFTNPTFLTKSVSAAWQINYRLRRIRRSSRRRKS